MVSPVEKPGAIGAEPWHDGVHSVMWTDCVRRDGHVRNSQQSRPKSIATVCWLVTQLPVELFTKRHRRSKSRRAARESAFGSTVRYLTGLPTVAMIAAAISSAEVRS